MRPCSPRFWSLASAVTLVAPAASTALADIDPNSGIDFVRIGAPGNAPWAGAGNPGDVAVGRGRVDYGYAIGKFEVTTAEWVEFFNAAYDRPANDRIPFLSVPTFWGAAATTPHTPGGLRWTVPAGNERRFVGNVSWRMAAVYANWLCSGKSTERNAFLNGGAYDVSTFGLGPTGFTDQAGHNPGAHYWIPTWDEWLKAAHYDPAKVNGDGTVGGWWRYANGSDRQPRYGAPGNGDANAGFGFDPTILLGAYTNIRSPFGLYDVMGATAEWNEEIIGAAGLREWRRNDGSAWSDSGGSASALDEVSYPAADFPSITTGDYGFRIASDVPAPGIMGTLGVVAGAAFARRRRSSHDRHPTALEDCLVTRFSVDSSASDRSGCAR